MGINTKKRMSLNRRLSRQERLARWLAGNYAKLKAKGKGDKAIDLRAKCRRRIVTLKKRISELV